MTTKELNRDIKRLYNEWLHFQYQSNDEYYKWVDSKMKPELKRLYLADSNIEYMNFFSFKALHRMNQAQGGIIPLHSFAIGMKP